MDFLSRTKMSVDTASRTFSFRFAPNLLGRFFEDDWGKQTEGYLQGLCDEAPNGVPDKRMWPEGVSAQSIMNEFPLLFSSSLGTANCLPYYIELADSTPVRSPPYKCAPPKLEIFRGIVNELLEHGVVRPSKYP